MNIMLVGCDHYAVCGGQDFSFGQAVEVDQRTAVELLAKEVDGRPMFVAPSGEAMRPVALRLADHRESFRIGQWAWSTAEPKDVPAAVAAELLRRRRNGKPIFIEEKKR